MAADLAQNNSTAVATKPIRVGLVGTGYIAEFHARAVRAIDGLELSSVCDLNPKNAQLFAATWNIQEAFDSLEAMIRNGRPDCVHLLVPPDLHYSLARTALEAGIHVLLEKPMCTDVTEADELLQLAKEKNLYLGVSHNFMFTGAYERLRELAHSGAIGPIDQITFQYLFELPQLRFGPFDSWMMRDPGNVILETAPHITSMLLDLTGKPDQLSVVVDRKTKLPGGATVFRQWRIRGNAGRAAIDVNINFAPGFPQRTVFVRGLFGSAMVDLDANTCITDQRTPLDIDIDRYSRTRMIARQLRSQGRATLADYILGKLKLRRRGNPYQNSIMGSVASFYGSMISGQPLDVRIEGSQGREIIDYCSKILAAAAIPVSTPYQPPPRLPPASKPTVLVLGASGFIGRELVTQLIASGYCVRALVRGSAAGLSEFAAERLEIVRGDVRNTGDLAEAMDGIEFVYHLAHAQAKTWDEYVKNDIEPARLVGEACIAANVKRLFYTGTIASYYTGAGAGTITEDTPLDPNIGTRDYYSRAKAASEKILLDMHRMQGLPLVIFRPGIVIGRGGTPFHWGVGRFSDNVCEVWGEGKNKLPFVLVADVASALVRGMEASGIDGRSFILVDTPLLTARDYLAELQSQTALKLNIQYRPIWRFYLSDMTKWVVKAMVKHPDRIRFPSYYDWEARTHKAIFDCSRTKTDLGWSPAGDRTRMVKDGIGGALESWLDAIR